MSAERCGQSELERGAKSPAAANLILGEIKTLLVATPNGLLSRLPFRAFSVVSIKLRACERWSKLTKNAFFCQSCGSLGNFTWFWLVSIKVRFIGERKIWGAGPLQYFPSSPPAEERGQRA